MPRKAPSAEDHAGHDRGSAIAVDEAPPPPRPALPSRGGKAIVYQGWQDPSVVALPTIDYYRALARDNGGVAAIARAVRLFMVPGMYHCRGGTGADGFGGSGQTSYPDRDILWAAIEWVEKGRVPKTLIAERAPSRDLPAVTRRLCSYPAQAKLTNARRSGSADGFECRRSGGLADRS